MSDVALVAIIGLGLLFGVIVVMVTHD